MFGWIRRFGVRAEASGPSMAELGKLILELQKHVKKIALDVDDLRREQIGRRIVERLRKFELRESPVKTEANRWADLWLAARGDFDHDQLSGERCSCGVARDLAGRFAAALVFRIHGRYYVSYACGLDMVSLVKSLRAWSEQFAVKTVGINPFNGRDLEYELRRLGFPVYLVDHSRECLQFMAKWLRRALEDQALSVRVSSEFDAECQNFDTRGGLPCQMGPIIQAMLTAGPLIDQLPPC